MRWTKVLTVGPRLPSIAATAACGAPASRRRAARHTSTPKQVEKAAAGLMPDAKGPAPEIPGAKKGGTLTISTRPSRRHGPERRSSTRTRAVDPVAHHRALTTFVPDRRQERARARTSPPTSARPPADGLDWTFTLKDGLKYEDGTPVKAEDIVYAIKRSFDPEERPAARPTRTSSSRAATTYKGPYKW